MRRSTRVRRFPTYIDPALVGDGGADSHRSKDVAATSSAPTRAGARATAVASSSATASPAERIASTSSAKPTQLKQKRGQNAAGKRAAPSLAMGGSADSPLMARMIRNQSAEAKEAADVSDTILDPDTTLAVTRPAIPSTLPARMPAEKRLSSSLATSSALGAALKREEEAKRQSIAARGRARIEEEEQKRTLYGSKRRRMERQALRQARQDGGGSVSAATSSAAPQKRSWHPPWSAQTLAMAARDQTAATRSVSDTTVPGPCHRDNGDTAADGLPEHLQGGQAEIGVTAESHLEQNTDPQRKGSEAIGDTAAVTSATLAESLSKEQESASTSTQSGYLADSSASVDKVKLPEALPDTKAHGHQTVAVEKDLAIRPKPLAALLAESDPMHRHLVVVPQAVGEVVDEDRNPTSGGHMPDKIVNDLLVGRLSDKENVKPRSVHAVVWRGQEMINTYFSPSTATWFRPSRVPPSRALLSDWLDSERNEKARL